MDVRDRFEYQELDGLPLHQGVTKWNKTVSVAERAGAMTRAAIRAATGVPPGPVHLEIPAEMLTEEAPASDIYRDEDLGSVNSRRVTPDLNALRRLVEVLLTAEKPLIVAGKGVVISEAWDELTEFAELCGIPVATSLGGKGAISEMNDLAVGVIGRNSRRVGNDTVRASDTILAIGTRLGGLATHRWHLPFGEKRLLHIDPDPQILGHDFRTEISVVSDAKLALREAITIAKTMKRPAVGSRWSEGVKQSIRDWRGNAQEHAKSRASDGIHPAAAVAALRAVMDPQDMIGADTGAHGGWIGGLFPVEAGKTMVRANGSLGWVFPGAMGAALARPQHRTVAWTGDGGMLYHIAEFETALRCNIPIVAVVLNNACLASEYHTQRRRLNRTVNEILDFRDVDFGAVARALGAHGARVTDTADLEDAFRDALKSGMPALVDVVTSKEAQSPSANFDKTRAV